MPDLRASQARLNAARARKRRQAAGPALEITDAQIETLGVVGPEIVPELESYIRDVAGERGVEMLRAEREA